MPHPTARVLAVCTGNICRSPAIERLLAARLPGVDVTSAGTCAVVGQPMSARMARLVESTGASADGFTARQLTPGILAGQDLVVVASREHRAAVVRLAPGLVRRTFTLLELARLLTVAAPPAGDITERVRALPALAASARRRVEPGVDDVVDPIGQSDVVYRRSFEQIAPAVDVLVGALTAVRA